MEPGLKFDYTIITGAVSLKAHIEFLEEIRKYSHTVVALGTCATPECQSIE